MEHVVRMRAARRLHPASTATLALAGLALASLAACATPQAGSAAISAPVPAAAAPAPPANASGDCPGIKRELDAMSARGEGRSAAYRSLLDRYLSRCFG